MNIEELRQYCLSLPESVEKLPFERFFRGRHSILAFYTAGHIFCFIDIDNPDICTVRCPAARRDELAERYEGIVSPYNMLRPEAQDRYMDLFTRVFHITREQLISKAINDVKLEVE